MAWEEESIESGADFEEVGGKKGKIKMIIILLLVVGLGAAAWFFKDKLLGGDDKKEPKKAETASSAPAPSEAGESDAATPSDPAAPGDPAAQQGFQVKLDKFTVNLSGTSGSHFMVATIVLEVTTQQLRDEYVDVEDKTLAMIKTRDTVNDLLGSKSLEEARDPSARKEFAKEIKFRVNRFLKSGQVANVYFAEVIVD